MSSKSRKNGLQLMLLLRLTVEILSCYILPTECLGTMGTQKNHLILYLRYASFSYKKTLVKESESFFKVDLCPTILQSLLPFSGLNGIVSVENGTATPV